MAKKKALKSDGSVLLTLFNPYGLPSVGRIGSLLEDRGSANSNHIMELILRWLSHMGLSISEVYGKRTELALIADVRGTPSEKVDACLVSHIYKCTSIALEHLELTLGLPGFEAMDITSQHEPNQDARFEWPYPPPVMPPPDGWPRGQTNLSLYIRPKSLPAPPPTPNADDFLASLGLLPPGIPLKDSPGQPSRKAEAEENLVQPQITNLDPMTVDKDLPVTRDILPAGTMQIKHEVREQPTGSPSVADPSSGVADSSVRKEQVNIRESSQSHDLQPMTNERVFSALGSILNAEEQIKREVKEEPDLSSNNTVMTEGGDNHTALDSNSRVMTEEESIVEHLTVLSKILAAEASIKREIQEESDDASLTTVVKAEPGDESSGRILHQDEDETDDEEERFFSRGKERSIAMSNDDSIGVKQEAQVEPEEKGASDSAEIDIPPSSSPLRRITPEPTEERAGIANLRLESVTSDHAEKGTYFIREATNVEEEEGEIQDVLNRRSVSVFKRERSESLGPSSSWKASTHGQVDLHFKKPKLEDR